MGSNSEGIFWVSFKKKALIIIFIRFSYKLKIYEKETNTKISSGQKIGIKTNQMQIIQNKN